MRSRSSHILSSDKLRCWFSSGSQTGWCLLKLPSQSILSDGVGVGGEAASNVEEAIVVVAVTVYVE